MNGVYVTCYGETTYWKSRRKAAKFYLDGMIATSPSAESDRYCDIYSQIVAGYDFCTDGT